MITTNRRSLGSGLDAILGAVNKNIHEIEKDPRKIQELKYVMVQNLIPGRYQPRREFNQKALQELSDSIVAQGLLQPIVARPYNGRDYEIIAGERRWRAAQMAGLQQVPVIICDISNESALAFGLIENIQRKDLNPIEEAYALQRLIDEFSMTHEQVAKSIGRSRTVVSNMLRLLNLSEFIKEKLINKELDVGHTKILLTFSVEEQNELAEIISGKNLTVREAEKLIQLRKQLIHKSIGVTRHPKLAHWESELSKKLGTKVDVHVNTLGRGKLTVHINSEQDLECILEML
jgi:ParB family chromosome partitioning protein